MLTQCFVWLNAIANLLGSVLLAPVAWMPGWLSATLIALVTGIAMLIVFKHTSNQRAIKRTRGLIKANLLALSLFKDDLRVGLRCQGALLWGAAQLLAFSVVPMLVMTIPMCLLLGQLALWYQARPLLVGEEAVVTVHLKQLSQDPSLEVRLVSHASLPTTIGPVRVPPQNMVCWNIKAAQAGRHVLTFDVAGHSVTKEIVVGDGFMPTSQKRPAWNPTDVLLHPHERPFTDSSLVESIEVDFPGRSSWTSGSNSWLAYWFVVSMLAAFIVRPLVRVNI